MTSDFKQRHFHHLGVSHEKTKQYVTKFNANARNPEFLNSTGLFNLLYLLNLNNNIAPGADHNILLLNAGYN